MSFSAIPLKAPLKSSLKTLSACATLLLLAGCSALSPYSTLTKLDLTLSANDRLNPDLHGRPSPIVVRLIELKNPVAFENVDFFSLYERPKESLAPDLVASEELELRPGESLDLKLSVDSGSRYVGVLAAYRDLPETKWRYVVSLSPNERTHAELRLDQAGIHYALAPNGATGD
ncbi:MAG: type secretion protein [Pseudomonas sp.]|nr:type secretion protein [Pseudomonas sp.]